MYVDLIFNPLTNALVCSSIDNKKNTLLINKNNMEVILLPRPMLHSNQYRPISVCTVILYIRSLFSNQNIDKKCHNAFFMGIIDSRIMMFFSIYKKNKIDVYEQDIKTLNVVGFFFLAPSVVLT